MTVILPQAPESESDEQGTVGIIQRYKQNNFDPEGVFLLHQKKPKWSDKTQSYNLNFYGRVKLPSVKNFVLIYKPTREDEADFIKASERDKTALLFGKYSETKFTMDVRYPLSIFQAFAISLSAFDPKLGCE